MSDKRKPEQAAYSRLRTMFLKEHQFCLACLRVREAHGHGWANCARATDVHHRMGRGKYLNDVATWLPVCRTCHDYIETHKRWARLPDINLIWYK